MSLFEDYFCTNLILNNKKFDFLSKSFKYRMMFNNQKGKYT